MNIVYGPITFLGFTFVNSLVTYVVTGVYAKCELWFFSVDE